MKGSTVAEHAIKSGHENSWDRGEAIDSEQKWCARNFEAKNRCTSRVSALTAS